MKSQKLPDNAPDEQPENEMENDLPICDERDARELLVALNSCQQELLESKNAYLRAHADFDNFRKRMRTERDQEFSRGSDRVLADLLPIIDDFTRALAAVNENSTVASLQHGVELISRQLMALLEKNGISPMEVEGKPFDPKYHDAVAQIVSDAHPEHTIIGEAQRGYLRQGDAFRPAKVVVSIVPEDAEHTPLDAEA